MKTPTRLAELQTKLEDIRPRPNLGIFNGDVVHNGYVESDFDWWVPKT